MCRESIFTAFLGSRNDYYGKTTSGIPRRINRENWIIRRWKSIDGRNEPKRNFDTLIERLKIRRAESAFSPQANQKVLKLNEQVLSFVRENEKTKERIHVLINVSRKEQSIAYKELHGCDLLTGKNVEGEITLKAWECAWVKESCL